MFKITQSELQELVDRFQIGKILSYSRAGGHANANYNVTTEQGEYILKIQLEKPDKAEKEKEVAYLQRLLEYNIPAVEYLELSDGSHFYQTKDDYVVMVMPKCNGIEPAINLDTAKKAARILAKLHLVPTHDLPHRDHWLSRKRLQKQIDVLTAEFTDSVEVQEMLKVYQGVLGPSHIIEELPQAIVHGDLFPENILYFEDEVSAIIDWEEVGVGAALFDYLQAVLGFCFYDGEFHKDLYQVFYQEYNRVRLFTVAEKDFYQEAMRYVVLNLTAWFYLRHNYYIPNQEKKDEYKMYAKINQESWQIPK